LIDAKANEGVLVFGGTVQLGAKVDVALVSASVICPSQVDTQNLFT